MTKSRKYLLLGVTVWSMAVTLLRALRLPNDYAEAHWLVDYRFGFIKRGLIGAMFSAWSRYTQLPQTEWSITVLSLIMTGVFCLVLLAISYRIILRLDWDSDAFLFVNVFLTSPFIVMSAHLVGYYDNIVIVLTFCAVLLLTHNHSWEAVFLQSVIVLIHESYIFLGMPWILLASSLIVIVGKTGRWAVTSLWPLFPPLLVFAILAFYQSIFMNREYLETMLIDRLSSFDFIGDQRNILAPQWLLTSFPTFLRAQHVFFLQRLTRFDMFIAVAPPVFTLLYFTIKKFKVRLTSIESFLVMFVVLAPLVMHAIAWDTERITTYVIVCAFSVAWIYADIVPSLRCGKIPHFYLFAFPTLFLNIFNRISLMDGEIERFTNRERLFLYAPVLISLSTAVYSHRFAKQDGDTAEENSTVAGA